MFPKKNPSGKLPTKPAPPSSPSSRSSSAGQGSGSTAQSAASSATATQQKPPSTSQSQKTVSRPASDGATTQSQRKTKTIAGTGQPPTTVQPLQKVGGKASGTAAVTKANSLATTGDASPKAVDKTARKAKGARGFFKRAQTIVGIHATSTAEATRLQEDKDRKKNWKRWGPYLSERQWATVREDYSADGSW